MKNSIYFRVLVCVIALFVVSCSTYFHVDNDGNIKSGYYTNNYTNIFPNYDCFTRISNDTVYIDFIFFSVFSGLDAPHHSGGPLYYFGDTLLLPPQKKGIWQGKYTQMKLINKKLYLSVKRPNNSLDSLHFSDYIIKFKLKGVNKEKFEQNLNLLKNKRLILRTQFKAYRLAGRDGVLFFQDFADKNNIFNMYDSLDHSNFQKEYQIFENKFFQELKPQKK